MKTEYRTPTRAELEDDQYHFVSVNLRHNVPLRSCNYHVTFMRVFPTGVWGI